MDAADCKIATIFCATARGSVREAGVHKKTVLPAGILRESANPWAQQFVADVQALRNSEDLADLLDEVIDNVIELIQREKFALPDPRVLRAHFRANIEEYREEKKIPNEEGGAFPCPALGADGPPCEMTFAAQTSLANHLARGKTGARGARRVARLMAVNNQRIACSTIHERSNSKQPHAR